jgi:predicted RND superfamily exporter protein
VLEGDQDLRYYRSVRARYGSDDFLIITYTPKQGLFTPASLAHLRKLRDSLLSLERIESVISILDVPLIGSPPISLKDVSQEVRTLESADTDIALARAELIGSPLYRNHIISEDGRTTALQVNLRRDPAYHSLLTRRDFLRERRLTAELTPEEAAELTAVSREFKDYSAALRDQAGADIATIRTIMDQHRDGAELHLGGVPMIASDMIDFIRHDLLTFGAGVVTFLLGMLAVFFRKPRWVVLPLLCCFAAVLFMFGYLGLVDWRVTVVSSNFTSLLLIITLSLTVHLVVRYNELHEDYPEAAQRSLVLETVRSKALPSVYTALTTVVAFGSLLFSDIRPVIDFGWMMAIGIGAAFLLSFVLFPAGLMLLRADRVPARRDFTGRLTAWLAYLVESHTKTTLAVFLIIGIVSLVGISRLTVENRFIDHFKDTTEIYRGMELVDRKLGGTTPLDVILDADPEFLDESAALEEFMDEEDEFMEGEEAEAGLSGTSYWYTISQLETLEEVHHYLEQLPETGKVLSLATTMKLLQQLNEGSKPDNLMLAIIYNKLPEAVKKALFDPYMSESGNQVRFAIRVIESDSRLRRNAFLREVRRHLVEEMEFPDAQVHLTGMLVLYNNLLQNLYRAQIESIGFVFLAITLMFLVLFRSVLLSIIGIIPNLVAAGMVLGMMGLFGIPLDIMTITIAAITIGIAVDDTIHYIHRFQVEMARDGDCLEAIKRCHASVGRAMYYTSIIVIAGFSILALSNFMPTVYFGVLTGMAMAVAMIANLTLLPVLLLLSKPAGKRSDNLANLVSD